MTDPAARSQEVFSQSRALLRGAIFAYAEGARNYRDAVLRLGEGIQGFLEARAREAALLSRRERLRLRVTREEAIREVVAAAGGDLSYDHVLQSLACFHVVRLLGAGADLGKTALGTIRLFAPLVRREAGASCLTPSGRMSERARHAYLPGREVWAVAGPAGFDPAAAFRRVVEGQWGRPRAAEYLRECGVGGRPPEAAPDAAAPVVPRKETFGALVPSQLVAVARGSTPRDLAGLILQMLGASPDPEAARKALLAELAAAKIRPPVSW